MIDKRLLQLLDSNDVEKRKKAVMALAQTKDRDALPHLARVFKNDGSAEVRDLAKKAGVYINKHAPAQPEPEPEVDLYDDDDYGYDDPYEEEEENDLYGIGYEDDEDVVEDRLYSDDIYGDGYGDDEEEMDDDLEEDIPLPSEVRVSESDRERARGYVNTAMDYNVRGDNKKSAETLQRAFRLNPGLMHDSYSRTLAATITGLDPDEAVRILGPSADDLRKRTGRGGTASGSTALSGIFALLMIVAAGVALAGYFVFPWIDVKDTPIQTGFESVTEQIQPLVEAEPLLGEVVDEFNNLTYEINGLNTTLATLNVISIYDALGLSRSVEILTDYGMSFESDQVEPGLLDYSLPFMPVMATLAILFGLVALRSSSVRTWLTAAILGLIGLAPLMYYYLDAVNAILGEEMTSPEFGDAALKSGADLLGIGFWLSVAGMLAVVIIPFLAMLTMPSKKE